LLIILGILVLTPLFTASRLLTAGTLLCAMPIPINLAGGVSLQTLLLAPLGLALILTKSAKQRFSADVALLSCLLLVLVVTFLASPEDAFPGVVSWLAFVLWLVAVPCVGRSVEPRRLVQLLAITGLIAAGLSAIGQLTHISVMGHPLANTSLEVAEGLSSQRFAGVLGDYELFAEMMAISGVLCVWLASRYWGIRLVLWAAGAMLCFAELLFTGSRSAIFLAVGGAVAAFLAKGSVARRLAALSVSAVLGYVLSGVIVGAMADSQLIARVLNIPREGSFSEMLNRGSVWLPFIHSEHPFNSVLGYGLTYPYDQIGYYPHSLYLYLGYSLGWLGMVTFGVVLILCVGRIARGISAHQEIAYPLGLVLGIFVLNQIKIEFTRIDSYMLYVASLIGCCLAVQTSAPDSLAETRAEPTRAPVD
jgi:hypothetical protein